MEKKVERVWRIKKIKKIARGQLLGIRIFPEMTNFKSVRKNIRAEVK